jgi:hypothetical protein
MTQPNAKAQRPLLSSLVKAQLRQKLPYNSQHQAEIDQRALQQPSPNDVHGVETSNDAHLAQPDKLDLQLFCSYLRWRCLKDVDLRTQGDTQDIGLFDRAIHILDSYIDKRLYEAPHSLGELLYITLVSYQHHT